MAVNFVNAASGQSHEGHGSMMGGSMSGTHESDARTVSLQTGDCFANPGQDQCKPMIYSDDDIHKDIEMLCGSKGMSMPWMIGCTFYRSCEVTHSCRRNLLCLVDHVVPM